MLFVCLAHFTNSYFFLNGKEEIGANLVAIGMVASPTFVTVSGLVAGFLSVTRKSSFAGLRHKLFDRGVFLLLIGHLVLALSGPLAGTGFVNALAVVYITDAIGFAILIGPWLIAKLQPKSRLFLAATIFALNWCAVLFWTPSEGISALAKNALFGFVNPGPWESPSGGFSVIPWLAVYLVGTVIGQHVGECYARKNERLVHGFLAKIGIVSIFCGLGVKIVLVTVGRFAPLFVQANPDLMHFLSFYQKFPPGPVYLCFFGGVGMVLVAGVLEASRRGILPMVLNQLRQIGLASFFVYIVQFYLYSVLLRVLRLPYTPFWPLLLLFSIIVLAKAGTAWNSIEGNRFLTVGMGPFLDRNARRRREILDKQRFIDAPTG